MIAVIYDPATGQIIQSVQGSRASIEADPRPHLEVAVNRDDYDATHSVVDGRLVPIGDPA